MVSQTVKLRVLLVVCAGFLTAASLNSQTNTWTKVAGNSQLGAWERPALIYSPVTDEFVLTMGSQPTNTSVYSVQNFDRAQGRWINSLPSDTLYGVTGNANGVDSAAGKWADSTGLAYATCGQKTWGWTWKFMKVAGYLRPNTFTDARLTSAYSQFCYNTEDGRIYFYLNNVLSTYCPATRLWDTLSTIGAPNGILGPDLGLSTDPQGRQTYRLKWGALCYDGYNKELVLFGGCGLNLPNASAGTWVYKISTNTWTKLNLETEPVARAHSPMVYDPVNHAIVLFGGHHLDYFLNDTWIYDCASRTWSKKNPAVRPAARAGHAMVYLPKSQKVVMMGGYKLASNQTQEMEMWTYDVAANTWGLIKRFSGTDVWPKVAAFRPAFSGLAAADKGDTIFALADTILDGYSFKPITMAMACNPTAIDADGTLAFGITRDSIEVSNGANTPVWYKTGVAAPDTQANEAYLRALPTNTWVKMNPPKTPTGDRAWGTAVLAADKDAILRWSGGHAAYCATDVPQYSISENRWDGGMIPENPLEYWGNDGGPSPFTFNHHPMMQRHPCRALGYDVNAKKMLLIQYPHTYFYNPDSMDWDGDITQPVPDSTIPYSTYRVTLCSTPHGAYALWGDRGYLYDNEAKKWTRLPQTGVALPLFYADADGAAYDSKRDRIVYAVQATAYGTVTTPTQFYQYDFKTGAASQLLPADSETTYSAGITANYRDAVYIPTQDIVFYPIHTAQGFLAYDCANNRWLWYNLQGYASGMSDVSTGVMYDAKRDLVWLVDAGSNVYALRFGTPSQTEVKNGDSEGAVEAPVLSPNPLNPAAAVKFSCGKAQAVTLAVFDARGRKVMARSILAQKGVNRERLDFNKNNSGLYVIRLTVDGRVLTLRAVVMK